MWYYCNKLDFIPIECINKHINKYVIRLSPNNKFNTSIKDNKNELRFISKYINKYPTISYLKNILISLQKEYDKDFEVNSFYINNKSAWLDNNTRLKISNLINIEKSFGKTNTIIWFDTFFINISIDKAIELLSSVELYAKDCYNNTQQHINEINNLETIEDLLAFDITAGYPDKLIFNID